MYIMNYIHWSIGLRNNQVSLYLKTQEEDTNFIVSARTGK